jgi:hypothetical protein
MDYLFGKKIEKNDSNLFNFFEKNPNIGGYFNVSNNFGIENPLFPNDVNFNTWSLFRKMFVYTKKQSQSPQSNANKPTDYLRFKTEQEFIDEYGDNWQPKVFWVSNEMDYLFGKPLPSQYNIKNFVDNLYNTESEFGIKSPRFDDLWTINKFMLTDKPLPKSKKPTDYLRFKTEQEFIDEYGDNWRMDVNWNLYGDMDYLFGLPLPKSFKYENFDEKSYDTEQKFGIKSPNGDSDWSINKKMLTDKPLPKSKKPTQNLLPLDELDNKIQSIQDLVAESFSPDEIVVQEFLLEELKKLNKQKQESSLVKYYSNDLSALLDLYSRKISLPQREVMSVACGRETPSGAPSELDSMQYGWVRTIQFKAWFGYWEEA